MRNTIGLLFVFAVAPGPALAQRARDPVDPGLRPPVCDTARVPEFPSSLYGERHRLQIEADDRRGWLDVGMGWGRMHVGGARSSERSSFTLDFSVGRWLSNGLAVGARLGGWTLEGFNLHDPREGEALSEAFGLLKARPLASRPVMITLAGGWASYTSNDPAAAALNGDGVGWRAELEWDAWRSGQWSVGTALVASWGNVDPDAEENADFVYGGGALLVRARWRW